MVFSSLLFLFRFLPAVLIAYYIVPRSLRNLILFLFSLIFYAWGEPVYILLMLISIIVSYTSGIFIDRFQKMGKRRTAKGILIASSVISLSLLAFFKYADFMIETVNQLAGAGIDALHIALPIGISFYTFQTLSYMIDVYRGEACVQKNLISFGAYVAMFPQLIAGPIVQYKTIDRQLRVRKETTEQFAEGIHRFMIGLGHMFGFRFLENFICPYISKSITEFWHRWHISLSTWFREYVYIPLGGNRVNRWHQVCNILIVNAFFLYAVLMSKLTCLCTFHV